MRRVLFWCLSFGVGCGGGGGSSSPAAPVAADPNAAYAGFWRLDSLNGRKMPTALVATAGDTVFAVRRELSVTLAMPTTSGRADFVDSVYRHTNLGGTLGWQRADMTTRGGYAIGFLGSELVLTRVTGSAVAQLTFRMGTDGRLRRYGEGAQELNERWAR